MLADKTRRGEHLSAVVCGRGQLSRMHIGGGLFRLGAVVAPVHLAEILAATRPGAS